MKLKSEDSFCSDLVVRVSPVCRICIGYILTEAGVLENVYHFGCIVRILLDIQRHLRKGHRCS